MLAVLVHPQRPPIARRLPSESGNDHDFKELGSKQPPERAHRSAPQKAPHRGRTSPTLDHGDDYRHLDRSAAVVGAKLEGPHLGRPGRRASGSAVRGRATVNRFSLVAAR